MTCQGAVIVSHHRAGLYVGKVATDSTGADTSLELEDILSQVIAISPVGLQEAVDNAGSALPSQPGKLAQATDQFLDESQFRSPSCPGEDSFRP